MAISPDEEVVTRKVAPPAIVVKSPTSVKNQPQGEDAPQVPNPLAVASASDKKLSGLVSAVPSAMPTRSLDTVKISQGVSQGLLIKRVQPRYPQNALSMRIQGTVLLQATINKEGNIGNLKVVSGDPVLVRAATDAVHQWRYKPYYLNGEPVDIETQITINFKLPN
jgi:protein TonB